MLTVNSVNSFFLTTKKHKAIQQLLAFLKPVKYKLLLFLHFPDLRNFSITCRASFHFIPY